MIKQEILVMKDIAKSFNSIKVLHEVDFSICEGEVHALAGENGAGKSTLMNILMGAVKEDNGTIHLDGNLIKMNHPIDALSRGLIMIHQEINLIPDMTIAENIYAGREITKHRLVDKKSQIAKTEEILSNFGLSFNARDYPKYLSTAQMQMVEIAKAISFGARIIVMDEPTSSITQNDAEKLFSIIKRLKKDGVSFVYITHRLEEIFEIADKITILRDGYLVSNGNAEEYSYESIIKHMVGRELADYFPPSIAVPRETAILSCVNLSNDKDFHDVSFDVYPGEILGFSGLIGAGRTELLSAIFGRIKLTKGQIKLHGKNVTIRNPQEAIRYGLSLIPEDRKLVGLDLVGTVKENILTVVEPKYSRYGIINQKTRSRLAEKMVKDLSIKTKTITQNVSSLSGGNQQKVVLAKWLLSNPEILILDEPTKGIDVGSRAEIYRLIREMAKEGKAIILISSDMQEIIGLCDRVAVMSEGKLTGMLEQNELSQERIMELASQTQNRSMILE